MAIVSLVIVVLGIGNMLRYLDERGIIGHIRFLTSAWLTVLGLALFLSTVYPALNVKF